MICPRCQNQLPDGSIACNRCGLTFQFQQQAPLQQTVQKKSSKKLIIGLICGIVGVVLLAFIIPIALSYLPKDIDYGDAESFEKALNDGENCVGKVVQFRVDEFKSPLAGYNLWAGEHLNFLSFKNPGYSKGDIVTVEVTKVQHADGKWSIWYKKVKNGKFTDNTITSD